MVLALLLDHFAQTSFPLFLPLLAVFPEIALTVRLLYSSRARNGFEIFVVHRLHQLVNLSQCE